MEIRRFVSGLLQSNMYLILENGHAIVVDPFEDVAPGEGLIVDKIILTHEHYDHISGVNLWKKHFATPVLCSTACDKNMRSPWKSLARFFDVFCELQTWIKLDAIPEADTTYACEAEETFVDESEFIWQGHHFRLTEIPGHSRGSIGILVDGKHFFSGDSLMKDQPVELRFPGGSEKLWNTVGRPRIEGLPQGICVWPGHFDSFILE